MQIMDSSRMKMNEIDSKQMMIDDISIISRILVYKEKESESVWLKMKVVKWELLQIKRDSPNLE